MVIIVLVLQTIRVRRRNLRSRPMHSYKCRCPPAGPPCYTALPWFSVDGTHPREYFLPLIVMLRFCSLQDVGILISSSAVVCVGASSAVQELIVDLCNYVVWYLADLSAKCKECPHGYPGNQRLCSERQDLIIT
jgi:hypothetical protein